MDPGQVERFLLWTQGSVSIQSDCQLIQGEMPGSYPDSGNKEEIYKRGTGGNNVSIPLYDEEDSGSDLALKVSQQLDSTMQASLRSPPQYDYDFQQEGQESKYHPTLPGCASPGISGVVKYGMVRPAYVRRGQWRTPSSMETAVPTSTNSKVEEPSQ